MIMWNETNDNEIYCISYIHIYIYMIMNKRIDMALTMANERAWLRGQCKSVVEMTERWLGWDVLLRKNYYVVKCV